MDSFLADSRWSGISGILAVIAVVITIIAEREKLIPLYPVFMIIISIISVFFYREISKYISYSFFKIGYDGSFCGGLSLIFGVFIMVICYYINCNMEKKLTNGNIFSILISFFQSIIVIADSMVLIYFY